MTTALYFIYPIWRFRRIPREISAEVISLNFHLWFLGFPLGGWSFCFGKMTIKPLTPRPASSDGVDAGHGTAAQIPESILVS